MYKNSIRKSYFVACLVDENFLARLVSCLDTEDNAVTILVDTSDGSENEYSSVADVMKIPNSASSEILRIQIKATNRFSSFTNVSINAPKKMANSGKSFEIFISGNDKREVTHESQELTGIAESVKHSRFYSFPAQLQYFWATFYFMLLFYFLTWIVIGSYTSDGVSESLGVNGTVYVTAVLVILLPIFVGVSKLYAYVFPPVEFLIGAGIRRYKERKTARRILSAIVLLLVPHNSNSTYLKDSIPSDVNHLVKSTMLT